MAKYRKKPIVIEAEQCFFGRKWPDKVRGKYIDPIGKLHYCGFYDAFDGSPGIDYKLVVSTLEGDMEVSNGDWIITGIKGEKYPCKPDIFEQTYESVATGCHDVDEFYRD